ncbi:MAG TPA: DUF6325 family protein [Candidatus Limnocylindrales bacterium]|nr:DUF6325 family protein [Candidatus Limnocylindrales bacterium]
MSIGPVELVVIKYTGDRFTGVPAAKIQAMVDARIIRIIDVIFARKAGNGEVTILEINELEDEEAGTFTPIVADVTAYLNHDDVRALTANWAPRTSAVILLFENLWRGQLIEDIEQSGGEVVLAERIPGSVIQGLARAREDEAVKAGRSGGPGLLQGADVKPAQAEIRGG